MPGAIRGSFTSLFLYDVSEAILLERLRQILGLPPAGREPPFRQPAPQYVSFEQSPVMDQLPASELGGGQVTGFIAYYDYGVVSLRLDQPFDDDWEGVLALTSRWMNTVELEKQAAQVLEKHLRRASSALVKPYNERLTEDYYVIHIREVAGLPEPSAADLIEECGDYIAQIVRGEAAKFSPAERAEILESRMSYYYNDVAVVGWNAALVYDTPEGAATTFQLLEYANTQLLEFRFYDGVLTRLLSGVYRSLEKGTGILASWRLGREAARLKTIELDVRELTERVDNAIKFLSDMFAARLYRIAARRIGVPDYRTLVEQKLRSADELYGFMMDRFHQGRGFALELMVVVILVIELVFLFRGTK